MQLKRHALPIAVGALAIAAAAQVTVARDPVPLTLQTLAVLVVGGVLGPRRGSLAALLYVLLGILGLPVFAEGASTPGTAFLESKTAGFLVGFVPAAALAGIKAQRPLATLGLCLAAHAVILLIGGSVLALHIGVTPAVEHGIRPFLAGALLKSLVAAAIIMSLRGTRREHVS